MGKQNVFSFKKVFSGIRINFLLNMALVETTYGAYFSFTHIRPDSPSHSIRYVPTSDLRLQQSKRFFTNLFLIVMAFWNSKF